MGKKTDVHAVRGVRACATSGLQPVFPFTRAGASQLRDHERRTKEQGK
jgi:hypothetical protein